MMKRNAQPFFICRKWREPQHNFNFSDPFAVWVFVIGKTVQGVQDVILPEWSKGVHSSCIVFALVGSSPTDDIGVAPVV